MATATVDVKKLLEAGAHFGHKTSRWHPKMAPYIHSKRGAVHIIDLTKTADALSSAMDFLKETAASSKQILFVGTKRQAKDLVRKTAEATSMPFVTERWLGGMLTNQNTIAARIRHLKDLESRMESGTLAAKYGKLEMQRFGEEIDQMNYLYGGIKNMAARPGAIFIADVIHDANAVREANKLGIPVVAIVDTNADPSLIKYPIPANDDAVKTIALILEYIESAVEAGNKVKQSKKTETKEEK